jgi:hypothetical protein
MTQKIEQFREILNLEDISFIREKYKEIFPVPDVPYPYIQGNNKHYDINGNITYVINPNNHWIQRTYNDNKQILTYLDSEGLRQKSEFDENGKEIYYEMYVTKNDKIIDSYTRWRKTTFDENGNFTKQEFFNGKNTEVILPR